jgi:RNA polymerase sigma-B factor
VVATRTFAARDDDLDVAAEEYARSVAAAPPAQRPTRRDDFVHYCLPFADRLAHRYSGRGEPVDDLEQVSRMALVKAIDRYEPGRGSFTAYAVLTMTGELKKHFRDRTWGVHVTRRVQDLSLAVTKTSRDLTGELSRRPSPAEIAARLRVTEAEVNDALISAAGHSSASLNAPIREGETDELGDMFGEVDADLDLVDDKLTLAGLLRRLPAREQRMLAMRFYGNRTQQEIATEFGISQMHVSRLLAKALSWLRDAMLSDVPPAWPTTDGAHWELTVVRVAGELTVRVRGEVDRDTAGQLRACLERTVTAARPDGLLVVDLAAVPLVDAAGVAALVDGIRVAALAGVALRVTGARPQVRAVLDVCGLP